MSEGGWQDAVQSAGAPAEPFDDGNHRPHAGRGRAVFLGILAMMVAGTVTVVALRDGERSPAKDLARVRDFVADARTGRFEGTSLSQSGEGAEEPGYTSIDVSRLEGSFETPGRMHYIEDSGEYLDEVLQVPGAVYFRNAETRAELQAEPWVYHRAPEGEDAESAEAPTGLDEAGAMAVDAASDFTSTFAGPFDVSEVLGRMGTVQRESSGVLEAKTTMRELLPPEAVEAIEQEAAELEAQIPPEETAEGGIQGEIEIESYGMDAGFLDDPITIRLAHADDGRLDEMVVTTEGGEGEDRTVDTTTIRYSAWGHPVQLHAPPAAAVDPTPSIDEEDLAGFAAFTPLAPATPPPGTILRSATVSEEDEEFESCSSVDLDYAPPPPEDEEPGWHSYAPYLRISLMPASCRWAGGPTRVPEGDGPTEMVAVGPYQARVDSSRFGGPPEGESVLHFHFTAGDVVVDVDTTLPKEQAVATLATLAPLDLAAQPIQRVDVPS